MVVAELSSSVENADKFGEVLHEMAHACRREPGCLSYDVFRSVEHPERYVEIEKYADAAAFAAHRASDHFREIGMGKLAPMAVSRDVQLFSAPAAVPPVQP